VNDEIYANITVKVYLADVEPINDAIYPTED